IALVSARSLLCSRNVTLPRPVLFLSYARYGDPRHLHSFPTRRSSDLDQIFTPRITTHDPHPVAVKQNVGVFVSEGEPASEDVMEDRKSTRLNSSHVKISYAVFCLKKKNNQQHANDFVPHRRHAHALTL